MPKICFRCLGCRRFGVDCEGYIPELPKEDPYMDLSCYEPEDDEEEDEAPCVMDHRYLVTNTSELEHRRKINLRLHKAAEIVEIPMPTLSHWLNRGIITPERTWGEGRGRRYGLSFLNLVEIMIVARLRHYGMSLWQTRKAVEALERHRDIVLDCSGMVTLVTDGWSYFEVVEGGRKLAEIVRSHGNKRLFVIPVDKLGEKIRGKLLQIQQ